MTDLEISRLCAEAMGYELEHIVSEGPEHYRIRGICTYDPLHDDAQAMALVKKFRSYMEMHYTVDHWFRGVGEDLNRAICECVAKIQKEKQK